MGTLRRDLYGLPVWAWFVFGIVLGWYLYQPPMPRSGVFAAGDEDYRARAGGDYWTKLYGPHRARAFGLPEHFHHLCPVSWDGWTKSYPDALGVLGVKAYPDPANDDGVPCDEFGVHDWDRAVSCG